MDRVDSFREAMGNLQAMGTREHFPTRSARGMNDKDMEGVARRHEPAGIEDVARWMHVLQRFHAQSIVTKQLEGEWRIEQCNINASGIRRIGHHVFITGIAQQRPLGEIMQNGVVLHFTKGNKVRQLKVSHSIGRGLTTRQYLATDIVQLVPVARLIPVVHPFGCPLPIIFQRVVLTVEEVLAVQRHQCQQSRE